MLVEALETFKKKSNGKTVNPGEILDLPADKAAVLIEKGRVRQAPSHHEGGSEHPTLLNDREVGLKTENSGQSETVTWESPIFGRLEAPLIDHDADSFSLIHPLTGEAVTLPKEWLVSMDERSAILEYQAHLPREEADTQARREFFGLFRKGGQR